MYCFTESKIHPIYTLKSDIMTGHMYQKCSSKSDLSTMKEKAQTSAILTGSVFSNVGSLG